jgi:hypothetical protein
MQRLAASLRASLFNPVNVGGLYQKHSYSFVGRFSFSLELLIEGNSTTTTVLSIDSCIRKIKGLQP